MNKSIKSLMRAIIPPLSFLKNNYQLIAIYLILYVPVFFILHDKTVDIISKVTFIIFYNLTLAYLKSIIIDEIRSHIFVMVHISLFVWYSTLIIYDIEFFHFVDRLHKIVYMSFNSFILCVITWVSLFKIRISNSNLFDIKDVK